MDEDGQHTEANELTELTETTEEQDEENVEETDAPAEEHAQVASAHSRSSHHEEVAEAQESEEQPTDEPERAASEVQGEAGHADAIAEEDETADADAEANPSGEQEETPSQEQQGGEGEQGEEQGDQEQAAREEQLEAVVEQLREDAEDAATPAPEEEATDTVADTDTEHQSPASSAEEDDVSERPIKALKSSNLAEIREEEEEEDGEGRSYRGGSSRRSRQRTPGGYGEERGDGSYYDAEEDEDDEDEEEDEEDEAPIQFNREELLARYQAAMDDQDRLNGRNVQHQQKIADYFKRKKGDDARLEAEKSVSDQENKYNKLMAQLDEFRVKFEQEKRLRESDRSAFKERVDETVSACTQQEEQFFHYQKSIMTQSRYRNGRPLPSETTEGLILRDMQKEREVRDMLLENIRLKNQVAKLNKVLKSKDELADGLHMIDFEQLKVENQSYNEKIEERNEEIAKLRKKITNTVSVLTHLKEKIEFMQEENGREKEILRDTEEALAKHRDVLSRTKRVRDELRNDNQKLKQRCGLLGHNDLLCDFEAEVDVVGDKREHYDMLQKEYAEMIMRSSGLKKKIQKARTVEG